MNLASMGFLILLCLIIKFVTIIKKGDKRAILPFVYFVVKVFGMPWSIVVILLLGLALMVLERIVPARPLPKIRGWWPRVIVVNVLQAAIILGMGGFFSAFFAKNAIFDLKSLGAWPSAVVAYLITTFIYYWWHRWRHENRFLWRALHQLHHSPQRIETITSFYKHPFEIFTNAVLIAAIGYLLLGLDSEGAARLNVLTAAAEFFYHMNLKTPVWVGYFLQRPEAHRIHHQQGVHSGNFADLPLWDILFGTFKPGEKEVECGFRGDRENEIVPMLFLKNVNSADVRAKAQ